MKRLLSLSGGVLATAASLVCQPVDAQYPGAPYQAQPYRAPAPQQARYPQAQYPQAQHPQAGQYQQAQPQQQYPQAPGYAQMPQAPYARTAMGQQLPAPTEAIGQGHVAPQAAAPPVAPAVASYNAAGADCNCNQSAPVAAPTTSWEGYMPAAAPAGGCATGNCGTGNCGTGNCGTGNCDGGAAYGYAAGDAGCYSGGSYYAGNDCGVSYASAGPRRQWFAGIYGLYMGRDNPGKALSTVLIETPPGAGSRYYPAVGGADVFLFSSDAETDFTGGAEVRLGSTFGSATDPCSCTSYQPFAWELGYWGLAEDSNFAEIRDLDGITTGSRLYGMGINYGGLEFNRFATGLDADYRPLNDYYDYQVPVDGDSTNDIRVDAVRVTQTFQVQNMELNFWRFGTGGFGTGLVSASVGGGFGSGAGVGGGLGGNACGGFGAGGCSTGSCGCNSGCYSGGGCYSSGCNDGCYAAPAPQRRFFINGLAGVRYMRLDESFRNAVFFQSTAGGSTDVDYSGSMPTTGTTATQVLFHDIETDNDLVGFQLGCSMNCVATSRFTLFADTNFGIYGNQIDNYQRVFSPGGGVVRFVDGGGNAAVRSSKEDVAFLGEARVGAGYQVSSKCRLTAAYRVIGISGVALSVEQLTTPLNEEAFGHIDSNDSIVIHGLQTGVEVKY